MTIAPADLLLQWSHPSISDVRIGLLVVLLVIAAFVDLRTYRIPNWLTFGGTVMGLGLNTAIPWTALSAAWALDGFLNGLGGMAIGLVLLLPCYVLRVMGAGDVKLMAMVGAFLGLSQILPAVLCSFIAGGVAAIVFVVAKRSVARLALNLKHIFQGAALSMITGVPVPGMAPVASVGRLPYGVSISAGTIFYLASFQLGYV
jgi:prepilin peptidase CpaA